MVMKYAMGEKEVIVQRKGKEEAERKLKAMTQERDDMTTRAKALAQEKAKAQQIADSRHQVSAQTQLRCSRHFCLFSFPSHQGFDA